MLMPGPELDRLFPAGGAQEPPLCAEGPVQRRNRTPGNACLRTGRGMWRLRHARALAWRCCGPVCVRVYARVLVPPNLYIHTYMRRPPVEIEGDMYTCWGEDPAESPPGRTDVCM